jgi:hypothetical protein
MRCARKTLRLQRKARGLPIDDTTMSGECPVQLVARIELDARLVGVNFEHAATCRISHPRRKPRRTGSRRTQDEALVIAQPVEQLLVRLPDARACNAGDRPALSLFDLSPCSGSSSLRRLLARACPGQRFSRFANRCSPATAASPIAAHIALRCRLANISQL